MRMVDNLEFEPVLADVFLGGGKILHIHDERDFGSFLRGQSFEMCDFVVIEGGQLFSPLDGYNVGDAIEMRHRLVCAGEQTTAFEGGQLACMCDNLIQD